MFKPDLEEPSLTELKFEGGDPHWQHDYQFLNGIRGLGAVGVLFNHFFNKDEIDIFIDGAYCVEVFFVLSGFVLPISFLKSERE